MFAIYSQESNWLANINLLPRLLARQTGSTEGQKDAAIDCHRIDLRRIRLRHTPQ